jgi:hypothetical protein
VKENVALIYQKFITLGNEAAGGMILCILKLSSIGVRTNKSEKLILLRQQQKKAIRKDYKCSEQELVCL